MRWRLLLFFAIALVQSSYALAQTHDDICYQPPGSKTWIVSKKKLAGYLISNKSDAEALYAKASPWSSQPAWQTIFTDANFCTNNPGCLGKPKTSKPQNGSKPPSNRSKPPMDDSQAQDTLKDLRAALTSFILTQTTDGQYYSTRTPNMGPSYLFGDDTVNPIICVGTQPAIVSKAPGINTGPFRLRGSSDDLNIDATSQKNEFKSVKAATASFTRDGVATKTSFSGQGAFGYAIPLDFAKPAAATSSGAEVVPYISANESYSKVDGKAATLGDTNNWAVGALFDAYANFANDGLSVTHVFLIKPQYLWNTTDRSQIASTKFIWQPWTQSVSGPVLNSAFSIGPGSAGYYGQFLVDLRVDSGVYANKGTNPTTIPQHTSFGRGGSMFGFAVSTPSVGPYFTLRVTETLLDGFAGQYPFINLFQATLQYYFDSSGNIGVTLAYTNGRDEDTAQYAQTYTVGLSAKF